MISFIPMLARHLGLNDQDLLEQDVRLHSLLAACVGDPALGPHLVFKGGTCLIKCYLDYPRFSSDLDFAWIDASSPERGSEGSHAFRRRIRPTQRQIEAWFRELAGSRGYRAEPGESFRYGRSNRMMTITLRYDRVHGEAGLMKLQLNFEEPLIFPTVLAEARSLLRGRRPAEFNLLAGDPATSYAKPIPVTAYDPREILVEKCRALLTRTAAKSRDLVDLFLLETRKGLRVEEHGTAIVEKTRYAIIGAARYRAQATSFDEREALLLEEDVRPLLLKPIDLAAFDSYRKRVILYLKELLPEIVSSHDGGGRYIESPSHRPVKSSTLGHGRAD